MRYYQAFLKKEWLENVRTYKLMIMLIVFFIFGMMNPLFAKLTPQLLSSLAAEGMEITLPEPSALDSWTQFFKNISQMGLIVMVILFSGVLANELSKGTLINMLTKGLPRSAVILSKYTSMVLIWTISVLLSFFVTWGYTVYLFPGDETDHLFFSVFCLWLFGVFLLAILILAAVLVKKTYGCLLITGGVVVICMIGSIMPDFYRYNPLSLAAQNMDIINGTMESSSLYGAIGIAAVLSGVFICLAVLLFRKRRL